MNAPLRRLAVVVTALFTVLMLAATWTQFIDAGSLRANPHNSRTLYAELGRQRGPILVAGQAVASSVPSSDVYRYQRRYADGPLWAPVTGYFSVVGGRTGLEGSEDALLSGSSDQLFYRHVTDVLTGHQPSGAVVETTLDAAAQRAAAKALGDQRGAVVALDPATGAILAMYSSPSYDPGVLAGHTPSAVVKAYDALEAQPDHPLTDRAIGALYPPGSMFKLVDTAAALESGKYTSSSVLDGPAVLDLPQTSHGLANDDDRACGPGGRITMADALRISCNTAYAGLGMALGQGAISAQAARFGFGRTLRIPLLVTRSSFPTNLSQAALAQASIGQEDDLVTPLQAAMLSAAVADGGVLMQPQLVRTVRTSDLRVVDAPKPVELDRAVSAATARTMTTMMEGVVASGTGTPAQIPGVAVAGKTGTAQNAPGAAPHAWFTAFAPAGAPQIAVAVVVEHGGSSGSQASGGTVAAPIAKAVIEAYLGEGHHAATLGGSR